MAARCKVVFWNQHYQVSGLVMSFFHGEHRVIASANADNKSSFPAQLRDVNQALKNFQAESILVGGFLPEYICFELYMPHVGRTELKNMLTFELPRRIPYLYSETTTFFRIIPNDDNTGKDKIRVFALPTRVWNNFLEQMKSVGIKFDAYCHPFMAARLAKASLTAEFPQTAPGYFLIQMENGLAEMRMTEKRMTSDDRTGEILAKYGLQKCFYHDKKFLSEIPEELQLHRYKKYRTILILQIFILCCLTGALVYRYWTDQDRQIGKILEETRKLEGKLRQQNAKIEELRITSQFAEKMNEAVNRQAILPALEILSNTLPSNTWVSSFRYGNQRIALTLLVYGDSSNVNNKFASLEEWIVENQRQQQNDRGSETWYITLRGK